MADAEGHAEGGFARLSQATGTKVIHISERDTQGHPASRTSTSS